MTSLIHRSLFCFEIVLFVFTFFIWIAITVELSNIISNIAIALAAFAGILLYFWLSYFNGMLFDAVSLKTCSKFLSKFFLQNARVLDKVTDMPWYNWVPKDRQLLLPMILKLQHPSLLQLRGISGLKDVTYERFGETIQTVYNCCLVIQKMLK